MGKLTFDELLDRKSKQDKIGLATMNLEGVGKLGVIKIKTRDVCKIMDKYNISEDGNITDNFDMMCELIYKSVPTLKIQNAKEQLGVATPYEIVGELFSFGEISKIATFIMELHGLNDNKNSVVNEEIKN